MLSTELMSKWTREPVISFLNSGHEEERAVIAPQEARLIVDALARRWPVEVRPPVVRRLLQVFGHIEEIGPTWDQFPADELPVRHLHRSPATYGFMQPTISRAMGADMHRRQRLYEKRPNPTTCCFGHDLSGRDGYVRMDGGLDSRACDRVREKYKREHSHVLPNGGVADD